MNRCEKPLEKNAERGAIHCLFEPAVLGADLVQ